jgi:hypothetical protein
VFVLLGFSGLALVVPVYLGAPYAFFYKVFLLIKKKTDMVQVESLHLQRLIWFKLKAVKGQGRLIQIWVEKV